jgi:hypothetical protein
MARGDGSGPSQPACRFLAPEVGSDPLSTVITTHQTFHATAANAAQLHGVDRGHLLTALRLAGQPREPVTARLIYDTAAALAAAGYAGARRAG